MFRAQFERAACAVGPDGGSVVELIGWSCRRIDCLPQTDSDLSAAEIVGRFVMVRYLVGRVAAELSHKRDLAEAARRSPATCRRRLPDYLSVMFASHADRRWSSRATSQFCCDPAESAPGGRGGSPLQKAEMPARLFCHQSGGTEGELDVAAGWNGNRQMCVFFIQRVRCWWRASHRRFEIQRRGLGIPVANWLRWVLECCLKLHCVHLRRKRRKAACSHMFGSLTLRVCDEC